MWDGLLLCFVDEKTEAHEGEVAWTRFHSGW